MKDRNKIKIRTWNVGTLTGKRRELAEELALKRKKLVFCCV